MMIDLLWIFRPDAEVETRQRKASMNLAFKGAPEPQPEEKCSDETIDADGNSNDER